MWTILFLVLFCSGVTPFSLETSHNIKVGRWGATYLTNSDDCLFSKLIVIFPIPTYSEYGDISKLPWENLSFRDNCFFDDSYPLLPRLRAPISLHYLRTASLSQPSTLRSLMNSISRFRIWQLRLASIRRKLYVKHSEAHLRCDKLINSYNCSIDLVNLTRHIVCKLNIFRFWKSKSVTSKQVTKLRRALFMSTCEQLAGLIYVSIL